MRRTTALQAAEAERAASAEAAYEGARLAAEAAQVAEKLQRMVAAAEAAISGAKEFMPPPRGRLPQGQDDVTSGRLGFISLTLAPLSDKRYENSRSFSLYASVATPRTNRGGDIIDWKLLSTKRSYTATSEHPEQQKLEAELEVRRMAWELLRTFLPREKATRKRRSCQAESSSAPRMTSARTAVASASTETQTEKLC